MSGTDAEAPSPSSLARRFGAPRDGAVPRVENVRITAPDLARRRILERAHNRLVFASCGFAVLFAALVVKLADATIISPVEPKREAAVRRPTEPPPALPGTTVAAAMPTLADAMPRAQRAMVTDRNGEILAVSLPTAGLYANPREMIDQAEAARKLKQVIPALNEDEVRTRLTSAKQFVYLARRITPREELAVNNLGIPGVYFTPTERRRYPLGRVAAQVLGGVDVDERGVAGVEKAFDERLRSDAEPLKLSLDIRIQAVVREELEHAKDEFQAIGACGIVMDVRTGEVLAMVSLPDYDANDFGHAAEDERFNRAITGRYEPGSTFKLQTAAMALDSGAVALWSMFNAAEPIKIGRFTITDFEGKHRWLYLPEVLAYSSNLGAAHIAMAVGAERQRAWLQKMGMFDRIGIELPEVLPPIAPPVANWREAATMTVGFGHGIAVSPLHVVRGTAAVANGGIVLKPTILALPADAKPEGDRVMQQSTSDVMRKLMRLVVTDGYGKPAEVAGYFVGGKTGTAEKVGRGGYKKHANVSAFMSVFPMNAPRYAVYMMLDEPKANADSHGYATAGWVSAPAAGKVIARIGPILGMFPETGATAAATQAALAIPLEPARPPGAKLLEPGPAAEPWRTAPDKGEKGRPGAGVSAQRGPPAEPPPERKPPPAARDLRHEAVYEIPSSAAR